MITQEVSIRTSTPAIRPNRQELPNMVPCRLPASAQPRPL
jgi:hypothetical protein